MSRRHVEHPSIEFTRFRQVFVLLQGYGEGDRLVERQLARRRLVFANGHA
jgi:hypothetical protein